MCWVRPVNHSESAKDQDSEAPRTSLNRNEAAHLQRVPEEPDEEPHRRDRLRLRHLQHLLLRLRRRKEQGSAQRYRVCRSSNHLMVFFRQSIWIKASSCGRFHMETLRMEYGIMRR